MTEVPVYSKGEDEAELFTSLLEEDNVLLHLQSLSSKLTGLFPAFQASKIAKVLEGKDLQTQIDATEMDIKIIVTQIANSFGIDIPTGLNWDTRDYPPLTPR